MDNQLDATIMPYSSQLNVFRAK